MGRRKKGGWVANPIPSASELGKLLLSEGKKALKNSIKPTLNITKKELLNDNFKKQMKISGKSALIAAKNKFLTKKVKNHLIRSGKNLIKNNVKNTVKALSKNKKVAKGLFAFTGGRVIKMLVEGGMEAIAGLIVPE